jgi:Ca2+-binding EF-hand superfamily protein
MLSDLQRRKISHQFKMLDLNGDGFLSDPDVGMIVNNLAREFKVSPASDTFAALKAVYAAQWQQIQQFGDPNQDGRVSLDELLTYWDATLNTPGALDVLVTDYSQSYFALFELLDPDGPKNCYTPDRWGKYFVAHNQPYQDGVAGITAIDRNGSGLVDVTEAVRAMREFFGSDPDAPGNILFGPY